MNRLLRIGTRSSALALHQAEMVMRALTSTAAVLTPIQSEGDLTLDRALSSFGGEGVFTKALDDALLNDEVDLAVHSCKDIPTAENPGLCIVAVLPRADVRDVLVCREHFDWLAHADAIVATGSPRRKAQWLQRFPSHQVTGLRGNIQTRLQKLADSTWDGAIFAAAALERLGLSESLPHMMLDWMLPAAAQGAIAIVTRRDDTAARQALKNLNHEPTWRCVQTEREFLRLMESGCSAPVAALAWYESDLFCFKAKLLHPEGGHAIEANVRVPHEEWETAATSAATQALAQGAAALVQLYKQK